MNNSVNNKKRVLVILNYFQSGVRNIAVFLSLSLLLFSFSLYFKDLNKFILGLLHSISLFLILVVVVICYFLNLDSVNFKKDNYILPKYYQSYISKWLKLIWVLKIVTLILVFIFLVIFVLDIRSILIRKQLNKNNTISSTMN